MSNACEQNAKLDQVPVFVNDQLVMLNRWTMTQLEAQAYREHKTLEKVFTEMFEEAISNPALLARVGEQCWAECVAA